MFTASFGSGLPPGGCDVAAGIVHENVDRPERGFRLGNRARDVLALGEIAEHALAADAELLADLCRHGGKCGALAIFCRPVLAHAVDGDVGAERRQLLGKGAAKPAPRARHQRHLACQNLRRVMRCHDLFLL
jgi:hypothetical protein